MSRFRHALLPIALIAAAGCRIGGTWDPTIVNSPLGATVEIRNGSGTREAELLMARADGLVILIDEEVRLARWADMARVRVRRMPAGYLNPGQPNPDMQHALRRVSRYPLGLTDDQFAELLASFGQTEPAIHR